MTEQVKGKLYFRPVMGSEEDMQAFYNSALNHECISKSKDFKSFYIYTPVHFKSPQLISKSIGYFFPTLTFFGFYYDVYISQVLFHNDEYRILTHDYVPEHSVPLFNEGGTVIGVGNLGKTAKNGIQSINFNSGYAAWIMDVEKTKEMRMPTHQLPF